MVPDETGRGLPRSLERLWARNARAAHGAQPGLSLERIVAAAIEMADAEGLGALSMAKLADRLGSATMSLYRHVASKEELYVFMLDAASGAPPPIDDPVTDWGTGLRDWAQALMAVYRRHPWILRIPLSGPPTTPGQLTWLEHGLRVQEPTRLPPGDKLNVALMVIGYVRGEAALANEMAGVAVADNPPTPYADVLATLIDDARFPALVALVDAGVFRPPAGAGRPGEDDRFAFGLRCLIEGVAELVRSHSERSG
jgi:AcrR family transcriptional regulator